MLLNKFMLIWLAEKKKKKPQFYRDRRSTMEASNNQI